MREERVRGCEGREGEGVREERVRGVREERVRGCEGREGEGV